LTIVLALVAFFGSALMASAAIAFGSMMADAADEHEHLFGARREGLYFAGWAFASKAATGGGTLLAGLLLQLINFPSDIAKQSTAAVVPEHAVTLLGACYGIGSSLLTLCALLVTLLYRLDRKTHAAILSELGARRAIAFDSVRTA
jgi:GPH family glycoside/pentoside/hexuronide:cation symporter